MIEIYRSIQLRFMSANTHLIEQRLPTQMFGVTLLRPCNFKDVSLNSSRCNFKAEHFPIQIEVKPSVQKILKITIV